MKWTWKKQQYKRRKQSAEPSDRACREVQSTSLRVHCYMYMTTQAQTARKVDIALQQWYKHSSSLTPPVRCVEPRSINWFEFLTKPGSRHRQSPARTVHKPLLVKFVRDRCRGRSQELGTAQLCRRSLAIIYRMILLRPHWFTKSQCAGRGCKRPTPGDSRRVPAICELLYYDVMHYVAMQEHARDTHLAAAYFHAASFRCRVLMICLQWPSENIILS